MVKRCIRWVKEREKSYPDRGNDDQVGEDRRRNAWVRSPPTGHKPRLPVWRPCRRRIAVPAPVGVARVLHKPPHERMP